MDKQMDMLRWLQKHSKCNHLRHATDGGEVILECSNTACVGFGERTLEDRTRPRTGKYGLKLCTHYDRSFNTRNRLRAKLDARKGDQMISA